MSDNLTRSEIQTYEDRMKTFENLSLHGSTIKDLASDGYFFTGPNSTIQCSACGWKFDTWECHNELQLRHGQISPQCRDIIFRNTVPIGQVGLSEELIRRLMTEPAAESCLKTFYKPHEVRKAIEDFHRQNGHCNFRGEDLANLIGNEQGS